MLMNVDSIEIKFGNGNVLEFRAGIDLENLESELPVGRVGIVFAESAHVKALERWAVFEFELEDRQVVVIHFQGFHTPALFPSLLVLAVAVENFHGGDSRTIPCESVFEKFALARSFCALYPRRRVVEIVGIGNFIIQLSDGFQLT